MNPRFLLAALSLSTATLSAAYSQGIDPRGIYFNDFTGSFNGTEWFQVTPVGTSTTLFNIRDIYGGGFTGTINANGDIVIPGIPTDGFFSGPDNFVIFPFNGQFTFTSNRAPTTDVDFPLILDSPQDANPLLDGQWSNTLRFFNPQTGQRSAPATEIITLSTTDERIRITDPGGLFFQGIFEDGLTAGFRALNNPNFQTPTGDFARFMGSTTNTGQDVLGEMNMIDINNFRATFLLQTRTPLGNQNQSVVEFVAERVVPLAQGDANGDGSVDAVDEMIVSSLQGVDFEGATYNLAADINADGIIDAADLAFFGGTSVGTSYCGPAAPNSSGVGATISGEGSATALGNDLTLRASDLPVNTLVLGVTSQTQDFVPSAGGSSGNLCLGGSIGRFVSQAGSSGASGTFDIALDLTSFPQPMGSVSVLAGDTWNFQAWFRDQMGGASTSNFTDGLTVTFN